MGNLDSPISFPRACPWKLVFSEEAGISNLKPSCWEATLLTSAPPRCPGLKPCRGRWRSYFSCPQREIFSEAPAHLPGPAARCCPPPPQQSPLSARLQPQTTSSTGAGCRHSRRTLPRLPSVLGAICLGGCLCASLTDAPSVQM